MPQGWHWPILRQGQIWSPMLLSGKKVKTMDFSEVTVVCDIKVGRCSQLNECMKLYEYQRSTSFIDLDPNHSDWIFVIFFSSVTADFNISSALRWAIQDQWSSGLYIVTSTCMLLFLYFESWLTHLTLSWSQNVEIKTKSNLNCVMFQLFPCISGVTETPKKCLKRQHSAPDFGSQVWGSNPAEGKILSKPK